MSTAYCNLRQTDAYRAHVLRKIFFTPYSLVAYCLVLAPLATTSVVERNSVPLQYGVLLLITTLWIAHRFRTYLRKNQNVTMGAQNIAHMLSYHMVEHLMEKKDMSATSFVESALESERGMFVLYQIGTKRSDLLSAWKDQDSTPTLERLLDWMLEAKQELQTSTLDSTATIYALFLHIPTIAALLDRADISIADVRVILACEVFHHEETEKRKHPFSPDSCVLTVGSIGKSWIHGYNTELERLTENLSSRSVGSVRKVQIHAKEKQVVFESIIGGRKKNFLLVGPPGIGKRTFVQNVTQAIQLHEMQRGLGSTDVLRLKTTTLLSGSESGDKELLSALEKTSFGGKYVLIIEDLPLLLEGSDPRMKNILFSLLEAKNVTTIALTTPQEYHGKIAPNPLLDSLYQKIILEPPTNDDVMRILFEEYFIIEQSHQISIPQRSLKRIIELSERFLGCTSMPAKAVDILREAVARTRAREESIVTEENVREVISQKSRIDVRTMTTDERLKLLVLEERLSRHVIGQKKAIGSIVSALKRARLDLGTRKKPMGTFLFLGTTGVGKTETAKALAEEYFGSEDCMIRVDMNDLSREDGVQTLVGGSGPSGFIEGVLTRRVQDRPFSLILLDEIEKAHTKVLAVLLQILDEGRLIDGAGMTTDFRNTIIIATSNAGSRFLATSNPMEGLATAEFRKALLMQIIEERTFSPEFLNRFDDVVIFETPTKDDIEKITILMLDELIRVTNEKHGIRITVEEEVIQELAKRGFDPTFGAREMRRTITKCIEDYIADRMLTKNLRRGDEIVIRAENLKM